MPATSTCAATWRPSSCCGSGGAASATTGTSRSATGHRTLARTIDGAFAVLSRRSTPRPTPRRPPRVVVGGPRGAAARQAARIHQGLHRGPVATGPSRSPRRTSPCRASNSRRSFRPGRRHADRAHAAARQAGRVHRRAARAVPRRAHGGWVGRDAAICKWAATDYEAPRGRRRARAARWVGVESVTTEVQALHRTKAQGRLESAARDFRASMEKLAGPGGADDHRRVAWTRGIHGG